MTDWAKVGAKSCRKGKTFEREIAKTLTRLTGVKWRRTICSGGQYEPYDVKCLEPGLFLPIECKNRVDITLLKVFQNPHILRGIVDNSSLVVFKDKRAVFVVASDEFLCYTGPSVDIPLAHFVLDGSAYTLFQLEYFTTLVRRIA